MESLPAIPETSAPPAIAVRPIGPRELAEAWCAATRPTTAKARAQDLRDFARWLRAGGPATAVASLLAAAPGIANGVALAYRGHLERIGRAPATIARRIASLRSVVALARTLGLVAWSLEVAAPRVEPLRDTRGPGDRGWDAVRELAKAEAATGEPIRVRDRAIVRMLHDLGLRVSELCGLDLADVERGAFHSVLHGEVAAAWILGKGRSQRERMALPAETARALAAWLAARGEAPGPVFHRLDRVHGGGRLTPRSVERMMARLGRRAGLERPLRPHGLRHHAITSALDRTNGDVRRVQRFSRHAKPETLLRYDDARRDGAADVSRLVSDED